MLFIGSAEYVVSPGRYAGVFFIVLLLGLLYPLSRFWKRHIPDPEMDEKWCEKNYVECFFIRHFSGVMVALFLVAGCAYALFVYLSWRHDESVRTELVEMTKIKARRLDEWRLQHLHFAKLSDKVSKSGEAAAKRDSRQGKTSEKRPEKKGHDKPELKFLDYRSAVSLRSADEVDEKLLPKQFIRQALESRSVSIGPLVRLKEDDGKEYSGLCMAVPVADEKVPGQTQSILLYHVDPSIFLYPFMEAMRINQPGERTLLLQKEALGLRVFGIRFDEVILPDSRNENDDGVSLAKAVLNGQTGFLKGVDVRGEPVVVHVVRIADSDWYIAQQVDEKDVKRQIQQLAWLIFFAAVLSVFLAGFLIFIWLRQRHLRYEAEHLKLALRQQALIQHYDFLSRYANDIILLIDDAGTIIEGNDRAEAAYGCSRVDMIGRNIRHFVSSSKRADFDAKWNQLKQEQSLIFETVGAHEDGTLFPVEISARVIEMEGERFIQFIIRDITEKKRSEELIWQQANFDQITGLPNRRMFMDALHHEIRKAARGKQSLALMFLDLDKFKDVNDTLGHAAGDQLLQQVAKRLKTCVRETDMVARLGGDEFTVILGSLVDFASVRRVAQSILKAIATPFVLEGSEVYISSSIGMTFYPEDADNVDTLLQNADQAMYTAKKAGGNCCHYFTQSMQEAVQTRLLLINDLRSALEKNQFEVVYQPILNLASGQIDHVEALIRWHHPERGIISPAEFIPLAEETGIIQQFSDWVFLQAARQAKKWQALIPGLRLGLNVSPAQLKGRGIDIHTWFDYLDKLALSPDTIIIEITERMLLEINDSITSQLLAFRHAGISVALDDFGTGYSSLSYLNRLDIDYVKIDQSFTKNIVHDKDDRTLCEAMTVMAHKLGIQVIAEGVEYQEQIDALLLMGCDYAQGFRVSQALSAQECEKFIQSPSDLIKRPSLFP